MNNVERDLFDMLQLTEQQFSKEKRNNVLLLLDVYCEVLNRCPNLSAVPMEEKLELIKILREKEIL